MRAEFKYNKHTKTDYVGTTNKTLISLKSRKLVKLSSNRVYRVHNGGIPLAVLLHVLGTKFSIKCPFTWS